MRGEIADDCKVLSQQTWEQERVNTWTTIGSLFVPFFPLPLPPFAAPSWLDNARIERVVLAQLGME